ncbi:MAG: FecR domain-containing protein [Nitrospiraceae bacterium]
MVHDHDEPPAPSAREQAVRWMVRLRSGSATQFDQDQFVAWLAEDPAHRQEFEQLAVMWRTLDEAKPLLETELSRTEAVYHPDRAMPRLLRWPQAGWWPLTASALAACFILATTWWLMSAPTTIHYETAKGEQRMVTLADGSSVFLNTASEIMARFSAHERLIALDHGEAWFEVRHDEERPFRVQVANGVVQDLGTQFIVNRSADKVLVSVLEGIVEVRVVAAPDSLRAAKPAVLHHDEQIWYDTDGRLSSIGSFNRSTIGAWRDGKLIFETRPLEQVLAEIARYRPEEIRIVDAGLKSIPVSGVFNIRDIHSFIQALRDALPIQATWVNPKLVILERAPAAAPPAKSSSR